MKLTVEYILSKMKTPLVAILVFFISAGMLLFFQKDIGGKTFFMLAGFAASYYAYHNLNNKLWSQIAKGVLIGLASVMFLFLIIETIKAATSNAQWDFMCFYMQGQLGLHKLAFYDPNSFNILMKNINFHYTFSDEFKLEILNVGFLSPPITMLIYAPLALFDYQTSRVIISLVTFIFIIVNTILANKIFIKNERSFYSLLMIFIVIMLLPGSNSTIEYNQTNFFILFFLILVIYNINKPVSGLYLALSVIIKPISGILILFFVFYKKWKSVIYFSGVTALLFCITGLIWGFHNIFGFLSSPPTKRLPQYLYEQGNNQSLIALFNRDLKVFGLTQHIINMLYYLSICILVAATYFSSKKLKKVNEQLSFFPFLLCMLMIYPSSLSHYMVDLIPVLIYLLLVKQQNKYFWVMLLLSLSFTRIEAFFTYLIIWIVLLCIGLSHFMYQKPEEDSINDSSINALRLNE